MTASITLTIENCERLPDGGPLQFRTRQRGFDIGREQHLDWTLPDPSRFISGRHCEVRFEKGGFWLYDISRNGTFLNGATARVKSPYRLADGDRLQIGHYIVAVAIEGGASAEDLQAPFGASPQVEIGSGSIWDTGTPAPAPMDRRAFLPPRQGAVRAPDFSEQYLDVPEFRPPRPEPSFGAVEPAPPAWERQAPAWPEPEPREVPPAAARPRE
ncbi:type VI secretion system-associated FHA domain protein, partial [Propylenella binzhouense]